ncbi:MULTISPECIES: hypothetical protein [unclassified Sphingomonas]|uniref:hypothetical protein n=1 Tax=unclassified Sphingomonas TaxID=196159 RepID=UPI002862A81D|nr:MULTISPECIES: hypothetical protein [unclassified Sphingomonas]MDR6116683.1 hypothetical protein [Sphingomonas sp. SORGH_AS_0789]MDR6149639.1 hypothetical protein [Sphingomonas sp. SORGH_AS_0742]
MIRVDVHHLIASLTYLAGSHKHLVLMRRQTIENRSIGLIEIERFAEMRECSRRLGNIAEALEMPAARASAARLAQNLDKVAPFHVALTPDRLSLVADEMAILTSAFHDELEARLLFAFPPASAQYFSSDPLFGEPVEDAFPDVAFDIAEAGKCRALGRWTAAVMHLMRVLESGLHALAKHVDVPSGENWNTVLGAIEGKLREVRRKVDGREEEQWAAEAGVHLRFIKNAWRNHAMHPLERYDEERAVQIFDNTRAFMQHLARKLSPSDLGDAD